MNNRKPPVIRNPNEIVVVVGDNGVAQQITRARLFRHAAHLEIVGPVSDWENLQKKYCGDRKIMKPDYGVHEQSDPNNFEPTPEPVFAMGDTVHDLPKAAPGLPEGFTAPPEFPDAPTFPEEAGVTPESAPEIPVVEPEKVVEPTLTPAQKARKTRLANAAAKKAAEESTDSE